MTSQIRCLVILFGISLGILWGFLGQALAKTVIINRTSSTWLFENPAISQENNEAVESLQPGDTLVLRWKIHSRRFSLKSEQHEKTYVIGELLGEGNTTKVFAIQDDPTRALRIPKNWNKPDFGPNLTPTYLYSWMYGHRRLSTKLKAIPKVFEYVEDLFIEVERIGEVGAPTLHDFLANPERFTEVQKLEMLEALEKLSRQTIDLIQVSDFYSGQLVYTKDRGWILLDWTAMVVWREDLSNSQRAKEEGKHFFSAMFKRDEFYTYRRYNRAMRITENVTYTAEQKAWFNRVTEVMVNSVYNERWIVWGRRFDRPRAVQVRRDCGRAQARSY